MTRIYRVAEFAKLAGVTVRTLQYYDRMELLKPSHSTTAGHRLYERSDLLRLQQILTLKWMGFSLEQIRSILRSPTYDLKTSLQMQKAAVDDQITRLQDASKALAWAAEQAEKTGAESLDAETIRAIIQGVAQPERPTWTQQYYSDEAWRSIRVRGMAMTPAEMKKSQEDWQQIFKDFEQIQGESPDSPAAQKLAARMHNLIEGFTGGDPEVEQGLRRLNEDAEAGKLPADFQGRTAYSDTPEDLRRLMQEALTIYQRRKKR